MSRMQFTEKYGPAVLIAGAAEGLGEAWSKAMAQRGMKLIMLDNQAEKLHSLSSQLKQEHGIETITLDIDLAEEGASNLIVEAIKEHRCRLLIYNAAYSVVKPFISQTSEDIVNYADINVKTQLSLVHAFSKYLVEKSEGGGIIMMSSLAGLLGMQMVTPYAATKAFAWNLAEGLHHELKPYDIDVMACIAGATSTPAYLKTNPSYGSIKPQVMIPQDVVEAALKRFGKRNLFIPGFTNRLNYFILTRLLPRKLASRLANNTIKRMYS